VIRPLARARKAEAKVALSGLVVNRTGGGGRSGQSDRDRFLAQTMISQGPAPSDADWRWLGESGEVAFDRLMPLASNPKQLVAYRSYRDLYQRVQDSDSGRQPKVAGECRMPCRWPRRKLSAAAMPRSSMWRRSGRKMSSAPVAARRKMGSSGAIDARTLLWRCDCSRGCGCRLADVRCYG
jgi:hypothetical protein